MYTTCPKCNYTRKPTDAADAGTCPSCGLIFAKYDAAMAGGSRFSKSSTTRRVASDSSGASEGTWAMWFIGAAILIGTGYSTFHKSNAPNVKTSPSLPVASDRTLAPLTEFVEFMELFDRDKSLSSLARAGQYTVVELYLDVCAYCRALEAALPDFIKKRPDVGIVRVHHPGQINISVTGSSEASFRQNAEALQAKMTRYAMCGTPHVEIYGPDKQPVAVDTCDKRTGTNYVWNWISKETGVRSQAPGGRTGM